MRSSDLRDQFNAAYLTEVSDAGLGGIDRAALMRPFLEQGVGKSTLHAWIAANLKVGVAAKAAGRLERRAAAARARGHPGAGEAAKVVPAGVVTALPPRVAPEVTLALGELDDALPPGRGLRVLDRLASLVATIETVMRHAQHEDGRVRNAKLLLAAAAQMRGCLETANRLVEGMRGVERTDRFFAALMAETAKLPPEVAEGLVMRMNAICCEWLVVV